MRDNGDTDVIDTSFDVYSDTPPGKDPDSKSPTLRRYHKLLWSKPLPGGTTFELSENTPRSYLHHSSLIGEFHLSSDALSHTYRYWKSMAPIIEQISPHEVEDFFRTCSTVGGYTVFPARIINRQQNINMARGTNRRIKDRFDLTLECIRLHYLGCESPLAAVLARYKDFFQLFKNFDSYVDFFLLKDLISDGGAGIDFFLPFSDFEGPAVPQNVPQYRTYRDNVVRFVLARNQRIEEDVKARLQS